MTVGGADATPAALLVGRLLGLGCHSPLLTRWIFPVAANFTPQRITQGPDRDARPRVRRGRGPGAFRFKRRTRWGYGSGAGGAAAPGGGRRGLSALCRGRRSAAAPGSNPKSPHGEFYIG
ncbi:hypothetical protein GCM10009612_73280 [Streptomyces beijiangensis]